MKKLIALLALGCILPVFVNAQTTVQGIAFSPSFMNVESKSRNYCFSLFPRPRVTECVPDASNTVGLKLNYWRRFESEKRPFFVEGGMGLRYFSHGLKEVEFIKEAETSIILSREEAQWDFQSLYINFSMALGYRFQVRQMPVRAYAGFFTDLPLWGKRKFNSFQTYYYDYFVYEDPSCQCMKLHKTPLSQPINEPGNTFEEVVVSNQFIGHLNGGLLGVEVDLPLKSRYRFSVGYRYERALKQPTSFRSFKLVDYHNLNLSIGVAKIKKTKIGQRLPEQQNRGFVLGTQANFIFYDDGNTKNLRGFDLAFGYNTKKGTRPELRLSTFSQLSGKEAGGVAVSGGVAFSTSKGYLVPRVGLTYALWTEWASELTKKSTGIYGGAGFQYPNTGKLRMEISMQARVWLGSAGNSTFQILTFGYGVNYFFGKN